MSIIEDVFMNILSMSTIATLIFILILIIRAHLKKKMSFSKISLLWIVFICTLIIPINFSSQLSIKNFIPLEDVAMVDLNKTYEYNDTDENLNITGNKIAETKVNYLSVFASIYAIVCLSMLAKDVCVYSQVVCLKNTPNIPKDIIEIFDYCKKKLNVKNDIMLIVQDKIKTPSLYGIKDTSILITNDILKLSNKELECIFIHELSHYKLKHHILYLLLNILRRVYWFNPFIHIAISKVKEDVEFAIDENVLKTNINKKDYLQTIIKILALNNGLKCPIPNICNEKAEVERRINQMKNIKNDTRYSILFIIALILCLSLITVSLASDDVKDDKKDVITEDVVVQKIEYMLPLKNANVTARMEERIHPITGEKVVHTGVDLVSNDSSDILAIADGKVIFAEFDNKTGNTIKILHDDGNTSVYAHGAEMFVTVGDKVTAGEKIMTVGSTGYAVGPHLHFELISSSGEYIDINGMFE